MGDHIIGEIGEIFTFGSHTVKVADRESEMVFTDGLNLAAEFRAVGAGGGRTLFAYLAGASVHSGCLPGNSFGIVGQIIVGGGSRSADFQFQSYLIADDISGSAPVYLAYVDSGGRFSVRGDRVEIKDCSGGREHGINAQFRSTGGVGGSAIKGDIQF